jgi:hypothetical protein
MITADTADRQAGCRLAQGSTGAPDSATRTEVGAQVGDAPTGSGVCSAFGVWQQSMIGQDVER